MKKISFLLIVSFLAINPIGAFAQKVDSTKVLDSLKLLNNKNAELYLRLADISFRAGDYNSVINYADSALNRNAKLPFAYQLKGEALFQKKEYAKTIEVMSAGVQLQNSNFSMHYYRGLSYHLIDSLKYASLIAQDMTWAVTINPLDSNSYYYKGMANFVLSEKEGAPKLIECINDLTQFIKLQPDNFVAHYIRGQASFFLGSSGQDGDGGEDNAGKYFVATAADMDECLRLDPNNPECLFYRCMSYLIIGDFAGVVKDATVLGKIDAKDKTEAPRKGFIFKRKDKSKK